MQTRRQLITAIGTIGTAALAAPLAAPFAAFAQTAPKVWRIAYLDFGSRQSMVDAGRMTALMQGLSGFGYVEGKHFIFDARYGEGQVERLDRFAAELVAQKPDVILTTGTPASRAAKRATATLPIVVIATADPVADGLAATLARPGGNVTGMSTGGGETVQKLVELLIVAVPKIKRIAVLTNPANARSADDLAQLLDALRKTGRSALPLRASTPAEIEQAFAAMTRDRAEGVVIAIDGFMLQQRAQIAALALKHRLPSIYPTPNYPEAGGLMSYGSDITDNFRRAAIFVDKIFKGARPGDLPFEQPMRYALVLNRKTADALGIKVSGELLLRADRVIE